MSRRKSARRKSRTGRWIVLGLVGAGVILGALVLARRPDPNAAASLEESDTSFSLPDQVGRPAPEFAAIGVDGKPYQVSPGDGRPKALIFYMGFR